ncbi:FAD-binding domain-containing protein, partial [Apiospora saccharicola]
ARDYLATRFFNSYRNEINRRQQQQPKGARKGSPETPASRSIFTILSLATVVEVASDSVIFHAYRTGGAKQHTTCGIDALRVKDFSSGSVSLPVDSEYTSLSEEYWSQTAWKHPSCIATPVDAVQVASLVKALVKNHVRFVIRSGVTHLFQATPTSVLEFWPP